MAVSRVTSARSRRGGGAMARFERDGQRAVVGRGARACAGEREKARAMEGCADARSRSRLVLSADCGLGSCASGRRAPTKLFTERRRRRTTPPTTTSAGRRRPCKKSAAADPETHQRPLAAVSQSGACMKSSTPRGLGFPGLITCVWVSWRLARQRSPGRHFPFSRSVLLPDPPFSADPQTHHKQTTPFLSPPNEPHTLLWRDRQRGRERDTEREIPREREHTRGRPSPRHTKRSFALPRPAPLRTRPATGEFSRATGAPRRARRSAAARGVVRGVLARRQGTFG